jgi:hypothetical protein
VGQQLRHVARPAGTGRHATSRKRLSPQHPARTHKHHHQRVRARPKKIKIYKKRDVVMRNDNRRCRQVVARSDNSVVTQSVRRFTRGGKGSVAGQWLSQYVSVCGGGRVVVAQNNNHDRCFIVVWVCGGGRVVVAQNNNRDRCFIVVVRKATTALRRGVIDAPVLSREATTALSHGVTDAPMSIRGGRGGIG